MFSFKMVHFILLQTEAAESQYLQSEDRANKLKQLLVKAKKDLAEAKKLVIIF